MTHLEDANADKAMASEPACCCKSAVTPDKSTMGRRLIGSMLPFERMQITAPCSKDSSHRGWGNAATLLFLPKCIWLRRCSGVLEWMLLGTAPLG